MPAAQSLIDICRIHVLWDRGSEDGARTAELISRHFDSIGMDRDGVAYRIPVRFASAPWSDGSPLPATVDLGRAVYNVVILLQDDVMQDHVKEWDGYVRAARAAIAARGNVDILIPFGSPSGDPPLPTDAAARIQYAYRKRWSGLASAAKDSRLLLHLLHAFRRHLAKLSGNTGREPLFVSHAKADGDVTARSIVDFVNDTGHDVPLETFYDAMELSPGENFQDSFTDHIRQGTLLAVVSDVYETRPWCVFELTTAKRARRPIILVDVGETRISRTFPYGANLPKVRVRPRIDDTSWIEPLLVEALSEGLRCDLFERQAARATAPLAGAALVLPRPPELFDLVDAATVPKVIVYPDPPVGEIEIQLLRRALEKISPQTRIFTLGELS